jgi:hypothetical protein
LAPEVGFFWTPGYWAWGGSGFIFYEGFWGPGVGFYGGINHDYGYSSKRLLPRAFLAIRYLQEIPTWPTSGATHVSCSLSLIKESSGNPTRLRSNRTMDHETPLITHRCHVTW